MPNHTHFIIESKDMITFVRSYKSYVAKRILAELRKDNRYDLLSILFSTQKKQYQFWKTGNWPVLIESEDFFQQKLDYIHENPVAKCYVEREEDWKYSSARNYYQNDHRIFRVDMP